MLIAKKGSELNLSPLVRIFGIGKSTTQMTDSAEELELDEEGTRISLTIVDTPGFGDQIDNEAR